MPVASWSPTSVSFQNVSTKGRSTKAASTGRAGRNPSRAVRAQTWHDPDIHGTWSAHPELSQASSMACGDCCCGVTLVAPPVPGAVRQKAGGAGAVRRWRRLLIGEEEISRTLLENMLTCTRHRTASCLPSPPPVRPGRTRPKSDRKPALDKPLICRGPTQTDPTP
jgi:hypothetical protein